MATIPNHTYNIQKWAIITLFEKSWLGYKSCLTDATPGGVGSMRTRGVKNWQNFADVFYGWPLTPPPPLLRTSFMDDPYYKTVFNEPIFRNHVIFTCSLSKSKFNPVKLFHCGIV